MSPQPKANNWPQMAALLVAIVASSCLLAEAKLPYKIALKDAAYTMTSQLIIPSGTIQIEEIHSDVLKRSRVDYRIGGCRAVPVGFSDWFGSFHADDQQVFEIYWDCKVVEHAAIGRALQLNILDSKDDSSKYVIGVARLLMDIEIQSERFKPVLEEGGSLGGDAYVAEFGQYRVTVYYGEGRVLALGVPSAIHISDNESSSNSVTVRLKSVAQFKGDASIFVGQTGLSSVQQPLSTGEELLFNVFALERARGCTRNLKKTITVLTRKYRFSFKANLLTKDKSPVQLVVGYEPELATLRVDRSDGLEWSQTISNFRHDRRYNVVRRVTSGVSDGAQDEANQVSCVVTGAGATGISPGPDGNVHALGDMLYGVSQVTHLGMARVRGMDAYVYEAHDSKLPVWLDVPSAYESQGGAREVRFGRLPDSKSQHKFTTVLYFSKLLSDSNSKLLLIEIFLDTHYEVFSIPIYEFSWDIRPSAPSGERWEDFFSLGDACLAPSTGNNHYARLNLQLKIGKSDDPSRAAVELAGSEWLQEPVKRDMALVKAIDSQFRIPSTLVYDLKSRYRDSDEVAMTLLIAERKKEPIKLKYIDRSKQGSAMYDETRVISFEHCYELVAHKHKDTLFAYSDYNSRCYILRGSQATKDPKSAKFPFTTYSEGQLEVYRIVHGAESELALENWVTELDETRNRMLNNGRMVLENPSAVEKRTGFIFRVAGVEVEHLNEKVSYDLDEHHLADVNKFPGLGLVADDPQNKLVEPKEMSEGAITFEQCQEACLIDLECEAYSTCIVDGKVQCVLSSVDFKVPTTVIELMLVRDKKSKLGEVSEIKLASGEPEVSTQSVDLSSVHIRKHPTCELHNKLYRDVFKRAGRVKIDLKGRLLRPVSHPEQCAEFCFLGTLATMRKELRRLHKTIHDKDDPGLSEGYSASHCGHYFYLEQKKLAKSKVKIPAEQIIGMNTDGATRGYCVFDDGSTSWDNVPVADKKKQKDARVSSSSESSSSLTFELRKFELDFSFLYEKKHGVSLVSSAMSPNEWVAYVKLKNKLDYTSEHLETMRKFVQAGGNVATMGPAGKAEYCARMCFTQWNALWPACRSFDVIELTAKAQVINTFACVYSTSTLRELRELGRTDLIRDNNTQKYFIQQAGDGVQVWHYEPRQGLVASSVEQHYLVGFDQSESRLEQMRRMAGASLHLSTFSLSLMIFIVLAVSFGVGMRARVSLSPRIENLLAIRTGLVNGHWRGDKDTLVDGAD